MRSSRWLFLAASLALSSAPAWAGGRRLIRPKLVAVLSQGLAGPSGPYQGQVVISRYYRVGLRRHRKTIKMRVYWAGPGRYRRDILGRSGKAEESVVADGRTQWIYDRSARRVWKGVAAASRPGRTAVARQAEALLSGHEARVSLGRRVAGRKTWRITLKSRSGGALSRRIWTDRKTGLVLKDELYGSNGKPVSVMHFSRVEFRRELPPKLFAFSPPADASVSPRLEPPALGLKQARAASGMRPELPSWLPSGYAFRTLKMMRQDGRPILHFQFSDGVDALSLFQCPSGVSLDFGAAKTRPVRLGFGPAQLAASEDGLILSWVRRGRRFVLVGPLSAADLERIAESVP